MSVSGRVLAAFLLAVATPPLASATLTPHVDAAVGREVRIRLVVENRGDDPVRAVAPEIRYRLLERHPDPAPLLRAGARHGWEVRFPRPPTEGTDALVVLVRHRDTLGRDAVAPYATTVTIGDTAGPVRLELTPAGGGRLSTVVARLTHDQPAMVRGRLITVLPDGYYTEPGSQAVEIPPGPGLEVPFVPQRLRGPLETQIPVAALLQYELGGVRRAAADNIVLRPGPPAAPPPVSPLVVGALALAAVVALLVFALRVSARRRRSAAA